MTKYQKPGPKRGKKKVAAKKAAKSKPIPQQVAEKATTRRVELKSRQHGKSTAAAIERGGHPMPPPGTPGYDRINGIHKPRFGEGSDTVGLMVCDTPTHPTVEEQYEAIAGEAREQRPCASCCRESITNGAIDWPAAAKLCSFKKERGADGHGLPAPRPPGPKSKFWRQYQDESGQFIGFAKALTKTKDQVISRLRLRKPKD